MSVITISQILEILEPRLTMLGLSVADVDVNTSLLEQGILDSMSFLELIVSLESNFGVELDLSELDPSDFTSINSIHKLLYDANEN